MQKLRLYISIIFLALLVIPMAEKLQHELEHLTEDHCGTQGLHYCVSEHSCHICNYVFSTSGYITTDNEELKLNPFAKNLLILAISSNPIFSPKYTFSLRGPPAC